MFQYFDTLLYVLQYTCLRLADYYWNAPYFFLSFCSFQFWAVAAFWQPLPDDGPRDVLYCIWHVLTETRYELQLILLVSHTK